MKIVACVPIKTNNERLPGKNTMKFFDGTPLMHFIQKSLVNICEINDIYVFSSDESIQKYCIENVNFLLRSSSLNSAQTTPADIIRAFMNEVDADIYIVAHATSPFVSSDAIADCIRAVANSNYDSAFTSNKIQKLLWSECGKPYNFSPENIPRTQDLPPLFAEVGAAYIFKKDVFLSSGRRIGENPYIREVGDIDAIDIDYHEDFELANIIYKEVILKNGINKVT